MQGIGSLKQGTKPLAIKLTSIRGIWNNWSIGPRPLRKLNVRLKHSLYFEIKDKKTGMIGWVVKTKSMFLVEIISATLKLTYFSSNSSLISQQIACQQEICN